MSALSRTHVTHIYIMVSLCFLASFIGYLDRVNMSVAVIAISRELDWSEVVKGTVLSAFGLGYLFSQIPGGWLSNRVGGKVMLAVSVIFYSLFTLLTPVAALASLSILIVARILLGAGEGVMYPAIYDLFGRTVPAEHRSRAVAIFASSVPVGTIVGLGATGWLITRFGWPSAFYAFGALGMTWVLAYWLFMRRAQLPEIKCDRQANAAIPWRSFVRSRAFWALCINHFCSNWILYLILAWLPSYLEGELGFSLAESSVIAMLPWIGKLVFINVGAAIADRLVQRGVSLTAVRKMMQGTAMIGCAIGFMTVGFAASNLAAVLIFTAIMCFTGLTVPGYASNHMDIAPRHAGVLMGITNTLGQIPSFVCVLFTGWIVHSTGSYFPAFLFSAGVATFGAVVWLLFASAEEIEIDAHA